MAYTQSDAELADRHVREGQDRIAGLEDGIAEARHLGHPTALAEQALATMLVTLGLMLDHQEAIHLALAGVELD